MVTPNYKGYYSAMLAYCSGQSTQRYPGEPEPLGALYGINQDEANEIAYEVHNAILIGNGTPRPVCLPMRPCNVVQLRKAYTRRGLKAVV